MREPAERATIAVVASVVALGFAALLHPWSTPSQELKIVCVEWLDAKGDAGWMTAEEYDPIARMVSCGHLVREDENFVVIALDRSVDGDEILYNQVGSVPRGMVQRTWEVR